MKYANIPFDLIAPDYPFNRKNTPEPQARFKAEVDDAVELWGNIIDYVAPEHFLSFVEEKYPGQMQSDDDFLVIDDLIDSLSIQAGVVMALNTPVSRPLLYRLNEYLCFLNNASINAGYLLSQGSFDRGDLTDYPDSDINVGSFYLACKVGLNVVYGDCKTHMDKFPDEFLSCLDSYEESLDANDIDREYTDNLLYILYCCGNAGVQGRSIPYIGDNHANISNSVKTPAYLRAECLSKLSDEHRLLLEPRYPLLKTEAYFRIRNSLENPNETLDTKVVFWGKSLTGCGYEAGVEAFFDAFAMAKIQKSIESSRYSTKDGHFGILKKSIALGFPALQIINCIAMGVDNSMERALIVRNTTFDEASRFLVTRSVIGLIDPSKPSAETIKNAFEEKKEKFGSEWRLALSLVDHAYIKTYLKSNPSHYSDYLAISMHDITRDKSWLKMVGDRSLLRDLVNTDLEY